MIKLEHSPDQSGYTAEEPSGAVRIETEGGPSIIYADLIESSSLVSVTWICDPAEYEALVRFYIEEINRGADSFLMDLQIEGPFEEEYEVSIVPETFILASQEGETYTVTAKLEVGQKLVDPAYDEYILNSYPSDGSELVNLLEHLVNTVLPGTF